MHLFQTIMSNQFTPEVHSILKFIQSKFTHPHTHQQKRTKMLTTDTVTLKSKAYKHIHTNKDTPTEPCLQESKLNSQSHTTGLFATLLLWDLINPDVIVQELRESCLLYTSPSPRDKPRSRMPSSA